MKKQAPRFRLKLWYKGKMVLSTDSGVLRRFFHLIRMKIWDKAYIKVIYLPTVFNDGTYTTKKELIEAYRDFTEADLIRSTYQTIW